MSRSVWHRTLVYLGLKDEPEEGYDELPERFGGEDIALRRMTIGRGEPPTGRYGDDEEESTTVRPLRSPETRSRDTSTLSNAPAPPTSLRTPIIEILVFDDVEAVGARYRTGQPVLFDVSKAGQKIGRRVIDFVSGLTYVSRGRLRKVGDRAFLLVPEGVELPNAEQRRLSELGYDVVAAGGGE